MIVVSDTTPLRYLVVLGQLDRLPRLFGRIHCPDAVIRECRHPCAPAVLREWAESPPAWLIVDTVGDVDSELAAAFDEGEAAAIALGQRLRAVVILIDEQDGPSLGPGARLRYGWNSERSCSGRHARLARLSSHRHPAANRDQLSHHSGSDRRCLAGRATTVAPPTPPNRSAGCSPTILAKGADVLGSQKHPVSFPLSLGRKCCQQKAESKN